MKNFAFIFARGGSKGLPNKNLKLLKGKPLLEYSINIAQSCKMISKIFVSSDSERILDLAKNLGANAIRRPDKISNDSSPEWLAWQHAVSHVENRYGNFDKFISLPTTSPLRRVEDVNEAITKISNEDADICIGITKADNNPYFNMVEYNQSHCLKIVKKLDKEVIRRQDQPKVFNVTTVVYVTTPDYIKKSNGVFDGKVIGVDIHKKNAIDIDDIYDFKFAESLMEVQQDEI
tara:strand:+ start:14550 stop:15248 length:699 start_codon:yes stop_codon:yes gene_type:complete